MDAIYGKQCSISNHNGEKIILICQNINCSQQQRICCIKCLKDHTKNDPQSNLDDFETEMSMQKTFTDLKRKFQEKLNEIRTQCLIQQYILFQQFKDFIQRWEFNLCSLNEILKKQNEFYFNKLRQLTVEDYLTNDYNLGIFKYIEKFDEEISNIEKLQNNYLKITLSQGNQNYQVPRQLINNPILRILAESQEVISKLAQRTFTNITQQSQFKNSTLNDNPHVYLCEIILKQGYELNTTNMQKQFEVIHENVLKNQLEEHQLEDYQIKYLQAYSLYYSEKKYETREQQFELVNLSLQKNQNYEKSKKLKDLIQKDIEEDLKKPNIDSNQNDNNQLQYKSTKEQKNGESHSQNGKKQFQNNLQHRQNQNLKENQSDQISQQDNVIILNKSEYYFDQSGNSDNQKSLQILKIPEIDICLMVDNTVSMKEQLGFIKSGLTKIDKKINSITQWSLITYEQELNTNKDLIKTLENVNRGLDQIEFYRDFITYQDIKQGLCKALNINWNSRVKVIIIITDSPHNKIQQFERDYGQFHSSNNMEDCLQQLIERKIHIIWEGFKDFQENQIFNEVQQYFKKRQPQRFYHYLIKYNLDDFVDDSIRILHEISQESIIFKKNDDQDYGNSNLNLKYHIKNDQN